MLGISIDSIDVVTASRCNCLINSECGCGATCQCLGFCQTFNPLYQKIKLAGFTKFAFVTLTPPTPTQVGNEFRLFSRVTDEYLKFHKFVKRYFIKNKYVTDFIAVSELTKKGQIHYHVFFSYTNKVSIIKTITQPLYYEGNVLMLHGTAPAKGLHYLFKEQLDMAEYFGVSDPIITSTSQTNALKEQVAKDSRGE